MCFCVSVKTEKVSSVERVANGRPAAQLVDEAGPSGECRLAGHVRTRVPEGLQGTLAMSSHMGKDRSPALGGLVPRG